MQLQLAPPNQSEISGLKHQVFLQGGGGGGGGGGGTFYPV